jgi:glyoxylase-like metal-dependent hydrolase (beta-lactamase superfamily II)
MNKPFHVWKDVYLVGSSELTHPMDCSVYLVDCGDLVLIDAGAGRSFDNLVANIESLGFKPEKLSAVILTHRHIDHIGSAWQFNQEFKAQVIAHELDAEAIETGIGVGAEYYGIPYHPCAVSLKLKGPEDILRYGPHELRILHIPGHTPGGVAVYVDMEKRILFGQDVHGPYFLPGADTRLAKVSLQKLMDLQADILCEGHFGIIQPKEAVIEYIEDYLLSL